MGRRVAIAGTVAVLVVFAAFAMLLTRGRPFGATIRLGNCDDVCPGLHGRRFWQRQHASHVALRAALFPAWRR